MDKNFLRSHQIDYIRAVTDALMAGKKTFRAEMAPGVGKITATLYLLTELVRAGKTRSVLVLVDQTSMAHQILHRMSESLQEYMCHFLEEHSLSQRPGVYVSTIQKFREQYAAYAENAFDLIAVIDCPMTEKTAQVLQHFDSFQLVVATPGVASADRTADFRYTMQAAIKDGYSALTQNTSIMRQTVLGMTPAEVDVELTMVVTTEPNVWKAKSDLKNRVVDISRVFGTKSREAANHPLSECFLASGWPNGSLVTLGPATLQRWGAVDRSSQLVLILEQFVAEGEMSESIVCERLRGMLDEGAVPFACLTDGSTFFLMRRFSNQAVKLSRAPQMKELEGLGHFTPILYMPGSGDELQAITKAIAPQKIVVDVTLTKKSHFASQELTALLPETTRQQVNASVHPLMVLLAWAVTVPSTRSVSISLPVYLAVSSQHQPLRTAVTSVLPLLSVLELPASPLREAGRGEELILHFGGNRQDVHFHLLTSRGDVNEFLTQPWFDSLSRWLHDETPTVGYSSPQAHVSVWRYTHNSPQLSALKDRLNRLGNLMSLGELCDIMLGVQIPAITEDQNDEEAVPYVQPSILGEAVDLGNAHRVRVGQDLSEDAWLRPGDVLLPRVPHEGATAVVFRASTRAVASNNVFVIRLKASDLSPDYLCEFLNSPAARFMLAHFGSGVTSRVSHIESLEGLPVPVVAHELRDSLEQSYDVEHSLLRKADELVARRRALFDSQSEQALQENLSHLKRMGKLLAAGVQRSDRLEFRIGNFYPFPLAFGFRLLDGLVNPGERYREQLRIAENMLAFLGSVSLSLLTSRQLRADSVLDLQSIWQGGISPGHWRQIVVGCCRSLRSLGGNPLASEILRLRIGSQEKGFGKSIDTLIQSLNDFKHHRGPSTSEDILQASHTIGEILRNCMDSLDFLTDFPIRMVADLDVNRRGGVILSCLRYVGDHPGLEQEEVKYPEPLKKGDLFLEIPHVAWVPLYPFISTWNCSSCQARETFFIDRWSRQDGGVRLKSFERGHTKDVADLAPDLLDWGISARE